MKQPEKIQTRKDEVRFKTSNIRRIIGKYLAANVLKTWKDLQISMQIAEFHVIFSLFFYVMNTITEWIMMRDLLSWLIMMRY